MSGGRALAARRLGRRAGRRRGAARGVGIGFDETADRVAAVAGGDRRRAEATGDRAARRRAPACGRIGRGRARQRRRDRRAVLHRSGAAGRQAHAPDRSTAGSARRARAICVSMPSRRTLSAPPLKPRATAAGSGDGAPPPRASDSSVPTTTCMSTSCSSSCSTRCFRAESSAAGAGRLAGGAWPWAAPAAPPAATRSALAAARHTAPEPVRRADAAENRGCERAKHEHSDVPELSDGLDARGPQLSSKQAPGSAATA